MRSGDFSVEIVPDFGGVARETESGHVLTRAGQVYSIRLRNHGPLRCVADLHIDGHVVTAGGLVINPWSSVDLERPIDGREAGRFTVVAEGNERTFGPDGGRENEELGLIEARFRRELPGGHEDWPRPLPSLPAARPDFQISPRVPHTPTTPRVPDTPTISAIASRRFLPEPSFSESDVSDVIERAAGTGLTGHSDQRFEPVTLGALEGEATVITLRLVIASEEALAAPRPLPDEKRVPARPAARP